MVKVEKCEENGDEFFFLNLKGLWCGGSNYSLWGDGVKKIQNCPKKCKILFVTMYFCSYCSCNFFESNNLKK